MVYPLIWNQIYVYVQILVYVWLKMCLDICQKKIRNISQSLPEPWLVLDGWMDDLRFYVLFNSVSVISGR